jgi:ATP adenylyltransferase
VTLLHRARAAVARARADGTLRPLTSEPFVVPDAGVPFVVRRIGAFEQKPRGTRDDDPFRPPWTDALFVEERGPDHALLLNKFPVLDDHLLLVTRAWRDQEDPPDDRDFAALRAALAELDALWFYNGGRAAGASQPHRHLQLVPRASLGEIPLEGLLREGLAAGGAGEPLPLRPPPPPGTGRGRGERGAGPLSGRAHAAGDA